MMKKKVMLFISVAVCVLLSACSDNKNQDHNTFSSVISETKESSASDNSNVPESDAPVSAEDTSKLQSSDDSAAASGDNYKFYFETPDGFAPDGGVYVKDGDEKNGVFGVSLNEGKVERKYFIYNLDRGIYLSSWVDNYEKDGCTIEEKSIAEYPTKVSEDAVKVTLKYKTSDNVEMNAIIYASPLENDNALILQCQYESSKNMEEVFDTLADSLEIVNV